MCPLLYTNTTSTNILNNIIKNRIKQIRYMSEKVKVLSAKKGQEKAGRNI